MTSLARSLEFRVDGDPVKWPRPRFALNGFSARGYQTREIVAWKQTVALAATAHVGRGRHQEQGPLAVELEFELRGPKVRKRQHRHATSLRTGDLDNLAKGVLDGLNGVLWRDDCQVVELRARKTYAAPGAVPGVLIRVSPAEDPPS